jgi:tetratricopeptide (TPR) repeat protein
MQNIFTSIVEFFTRESRSLLIIAFFIGITYIWGKLAEKEIYYRWLVKISPKNAGAHYNLGIFLEELSNRKEEAKQEFQKAIELNPDNSWAYYSLYYLLAEERNFDDAQKILSQMIELFPQDGA